MSERPLVSVVIPARNEAAHIGRCIEHIARQTYPAERVEVLVVDGASTDGTADLADRALASLVVTRSRVVPNPAATTPANLNAGLAEAHGDILCRVDARSLIPPDYVARAVSVLTSRPDVAVVGGAQVAVPPRSGPRGDGIARALNNRLAMGLSRYRRGAASGPADTVYLGAFRTAQLRDVGGWDERLPTNQDFDLNRRLSALGRVWFEAGLEVGYVPRSTVSEVFRQYHRFGRWKVRYWRLTGDVPRPRQLALLALPPAAGIAGVVLVLTSSHRRQAMVLTVLGAAAGAGVVDEVGGSGPSPGWRARTVAVATLGAIAGGWSLGVWAESLRGRR